MLRRILIGRGLRRQKDAAAQAWRARGFRGRSRLRDDDAVLRRARPRCGGARRLPNLLAITVPIETLRRAREIGVDFLDSSDAYGRGRNEELTASAVKGHRSEYVIASKFGNLR